MDHGQADALLDELGLFVHLQPLDIFLKTDESSHSFKVSTHISSLENTLVSSMHRICCDNMDAKSV